MASPPKFIISGAPASGKGTQCEFIKKEFNVIHLSTGDMLRAAADSGTSVGLKAKSFMDKGDLVPDDTIIDVVMNRLKQNDCIEKGWLLDGFPRTRAQADALQNAGIQCDVFIQLDVDDNLLVERVVGRRMDPATGKIYHMKYSPPPSDRPEIINRLVHRSDDTEEKVIIRINNYKNNLDSIVDKYGDRIIRLNGNRPPQLIWTELRSKALRALKFHVVFILGGPGSGKGTLCDRIKTEFNYCHLSAGDLLREETKNGGEIADLIKSIQLKGGLVPAELTVKLLLNAMTAAWLSSRQNQFLIDGFPRNNSNAAAWFQAMSSLAIVDMVVTLDCTEETMKERILIRSKTSGRSDDNEATLIKRFVTFRNDTEPILKSFDRVGKLRHIDASFPPHVVFNQAAVLFKSIPLLPLYERTLAVILPDSVAANNVPDIMKIMSNANISVIAKKLVTFDKSAVDTIFSKSSQQTLIPRITQFMTGSPSLVMILEGTDVIRTWQDLMGPSNPQEASVSCPSSIRGIYGTDEVNCSVFGSCNEEQAMNGIDFFFDPTSPGYRLTNSNQPQTDYSPVMTPRSSALSAILTYGGLPLEDTYAMIKPQSAQINYDDIMSIVHGHGFEVVSEIKTKLPISVAHQFYNEHIGKDFFEGLTGYMASGPIVGLHLRRVGAVTAWRHLIGPTNYDKAKIERYDSIRAKFAFDGRRNAVHGSDSNSSASRELGFFFSIGTFHTAPVASPHNMNLNQISSNMGPSITSTINSVNVAFTPHGNSLTPLSQRHAKKVHNVPSINRNDLVKMEAYATEELNPIMTNLVRNLVVSRPKDVEDVAISKLTDMKYQKLMTGNVQLDSITAIQEANCRS